MEKCLASEDTKGMVSPEEANLIEAARSDPTIFTQLYLAYVRPIYRYILSKVGEAKQAEDLTAQVFLEALESLPHYRHDGHFSAWLFSIARHKLVDYFRTHHSDLPIENQIGAIQGEGEALSQLIQSEETEHISRLIRQLDEPDQELLRLHLVAELSFGEIARLNHSKMEATKKRYYRLLIHLRQKLEPDHE